MIDSLDVTAGSTISIVVESVGSRWRQGVFVVTNDRLETNGVTGRAFQLWSDSAPGLVEVHVRETEGRVLVHNIWNSGRGKRRESQSATPGMLVEGLPDGSRRYRCNDIGHDPDFTSIGFLVAVQPLSG